MIYFILPNTGIIIISIVYGKTKYIPCVGTIPVIKFIKNWCRSLAWNTINKKEIKLLQQNGFGVLIYTVNRKQSMHRLMEAGVNGIFTDKPDLLKKIADENNNLTAL